LTSALTTLQQWLLFAGTVLIVGCVAWRLLIAPRLVPFGSNGPQVRSIEHRVARTGLIATLVLVVAWALRMVVLVMGFRDPFVPLWEDVSFLLFQVTWGSVWMVQGVVIALLFGTLMMAARQGGAHAAREADGAPLTGGPVWLVSGLLTLGLVATLALSSHAMGVESWKGLAVAADGLHTLAAGGWIGSLFVILAVGRAPSQDAGAPTLFAAQIQSFSPVALVSGITLVGMGVALSWTHLHAISDLWTSPYGRILSGKVGLVSVILGLGAWNWRKGIPVADTQDGAAEVRRRATGEVVLAVAVLLLTAILVHSPKP